MYDIHNLILLPNQAGKVAGDSNPRSRVTGKKTMKDEFLLQIVKIWSKNLLALAISAAITLLTTLLIHHGIATTL